MSHLMPVRSSEGKNPSASLRDSAKANRSCKEGCCSIAQLCACPPAQKPACSALTASSLEGSASACGAVQKAGLGLERENLTLPSQQSRRTLHHPAGLGAAAEVDTPSHPGHWSGSRGGPSGAGMVPQALGGDRDTIPLS